MREIIFDTETTGLHNKEDRIIEIGGIELLNRFPTGRTFHQYINPEGKKVHPDALAVHGITDDSLRDKPTFREISQKFMDFFDGAYLVAHNANFDMGFINAELGRIGRQPIAAEWVVDTLAMAKRKHPMGPNSLDALCRRYGIDNSRREKHGALLDSELLAEVYIELLGGKQAGFELETVTDTESVEVVEQFAIVVEPRAIALEPRLTAIEIEAHAKLVAKLGENAIWNNVLHP